MNGKQSKALHGKARAQSRNHREYRKALKRGLRFQRAVNVVRETRPGAPGYKPAKKASQYRPHGLIGARDFFTGERREWKPGPLMNRK